ncbi:site-specific integrase [Enterococcus pseudoavium]|uniref:Site-specific integrase n=1 Tax=Enterococcus pseudoavium TaxID=44007 RepID=A0AAE4I0C1_9ENTE|nr:MULTISPECIES: site-specific integrase [Enterococcus]MDT2396793.1 site-specific integrase [Enterococcus avium]MDT2711699.1 site-specific integrase [Enterococcus dongliensis]MDT2735750.1 site-specific integrase [Enterococcus pseudoavium]
MIKKYTKKDGSTAYLFKIYLGTDPITGKKIWTTRRGFSSKKSCQLAQNRLLVDVEENGFQKKSYETFLEIYELWFDSYKRTVKESTWAKTQEVFKLHILPIFANKKINQLKIPYCQSVVNRWFDSNSKQCTNFKNQVSRVLDYAISLEIIEKNPMKYISMPTKKDEFEEEKELNFYSKEELNSFLSYTKELSSPQAFVFFNLLAFTGMRKGEALALNWDDINFKDSTISINKTVTRGVKGRLIVVPPKTKKSARTISIDPQTMGILKDWRSKQKIDYMKLGYNTLQPKQLVFPNTNNDLMQDSRIRKWTLGVYKNHPELKRITIHGLRHTHCSLLFEAGASLSEVQDRLGHTDVRVTMNIYAHVTKQKKEETALKFANFMEN